MGWTGLHREKGLTHREFFEAEFPKAFGDGRLLDIATKNGVVYAALRSHLGERVVAIVILTQWNRGYYNFHYKEMDEEMGPAERECPERILDLLDETDSEYAIEWRADCRANIAKAKEARKVKKGMRVRFAEALKFTNGTTAQEFTFAGGSKFDGDNGGRYHITSWRKREYEVVPAWGEGRA